MLGEYRNSLCKHNFDSLNWRSHLVIDCSFIALSLLSLEFPYALLYILQLSSRLLRDIIDVDYDGLTAIVMLLAYLYSCIGLF